MSQDPIPKIVRDVIYAEDHRLLDDLVGREVIRNIRYGVADSFIRGILEERVRKDMIAQAYAGAFRLPRLHHGDYTPGIDMAGHRILFPLNFLNEPSITTGSTGCGKTTRNRFAILQIAPRVHGLWTYDFRKAEYSILKPYLARLGVELIVLPARSLRLNPLQVPEYVDPRDYAPNISEALVRILKLPPRAEKLLHAAILQLYAQFGVLEGARLYPTLFDLREIIVGNPNANPQAREALLDSLDPVLLSLHDVLCYRVGWTTNALSSMHLAFELGGVSETDKNLILNTLIVGEFLSRIARGISNPRMDLYIVCDEAARLVGDEEGSIADMIGLIRGTGIGLDLSIQSAQAARRIWSNVPNRWIGRCSSAMDYDAAGATCGLTEEQRRWLATHLVPGLFLGQLGQGEWRYPFLFRVPPMHFGDRNDEPRNYDDSERMKSLPVVPA